MLGMESTSKNAGNESTKVRKCAGKDTFERMNYLYQIANALATQNASSHVASVLYTNLLVAVSKKAVQRLDIDVKRTICKGCRCLLLAGITCRTKIKKRKSVWTCTRCGTRKIFPLEKRRAPWHQQAASVVETLEYKPT